LIIFFILARNSIKNIAKLFHLPLISKLRKTKLRSLYRLVNLILRLMVLNTQFMDLQEKSVSQPLVIIPATSYLLLALALMQAQCTEYPGATKSLTIHSSST
jgi:hypothetical protein